MRAYAIVVSIVAAGAAHAQSKPPAFPAKPVRLIVATSPGSQPDGISRLLAHKLSEAWGKPVVVDNRNGAGGTLAAGMVAKATPDGHTLLYSLPSFPIAAVLQPSLSYDPAKDFACVSQIGFSTNVLVATPALGVKSVKDLVAAAKAQPGKLIFGSGATGTAGHLSGARFNHIAGIKVVHVAFKGGPEAAIEVLAGRSSYTVSTMGVALPFVKDGRLVALGVTSPQRAPVLPDVPALSETMPEFRRPETSHAVLVPAGTPRGIVNAINRDIARALEQHDVKERLNSIAFVTAPTTPEECDRIVRAQIETLGGVVRDAGLKPK